MKTKGTPKKNGSGKGTRENRALDQQVEVNS